MPATVLLGPLFAFLSSLTWAIGTTRYSALAKQYPPFCINFHRAVIAFPTFAFLLFATGVIGGHGLTHAIKQMSAVDSVRMSWFAFSVICSYAFADVLFLWSTQSLGTPGALAIASTYPLWAAVAGWLFRDETMGLSRVLGLMITVAGTVLVILAGRQRRRDRGPAELTGAAKTDSYPLGIALALATSLLWALNAFSVSQASHGVSVLAAGTIRMFFAFAFSPIIGFALLRKFDVKALLLSKSDLRSSLWIFALEGFGGALLYTYGLANSSLAVAAVLTSLAPVLSIPIAWKFGDEKISRQKALGVLLVVIGVWFLV